MIDYLRVEDRKQIADCQFSVADLRRGKKKLRVDS
jgi:hypothetical protein